jgi:hypothetical protein
MVKGGLEPHMINYMNIENKLLLYVVGALY